MAADAQPYVAVVGPGEASVEEVRCAEEIGRGLAAAGAVIVCGGHGGVMAAACRGASEAGGLTIGILPGSDRRAANEWVSVTVATGLGELRNGLVVRAADVVVAIGGAYGTLSEVAFALKTRVPVVGVCTWDIDGVQRVQSADAAVRRALELSSARRT